MGLGKLDWAADSSLLENELRNWWGPAPAISKLYIDWFAMPLHPVLARLVLLGELTTGLALVAGYRLRLAALAGAAASGAASGAGAARSAADTATPPGPGMGATPRSSDE